MPPPPKRKPKARSPAKKKPAAAGERLQKVLAAAGHGSRRSCEELIIAGRVDVDGKTTDVLGTRVDPAKQEIRVDGVALPKKKFRCYLLNKPTGVVCTNHDPSGRTRVIDLVPADQRLFTVGRLDMSSEGLILVTNDGDLANELAHPRYGVEKLYEVEVAGKPEPEQLRQLRTGIHLAEAFVKVEAIKVKRRRPNSTVLEITLREGRNREIRRILARLGHKVLCLKRVAMGQFKLAKIPSGAYRELSIAEVETLRKQKPARKPVHGRPAKSTDSPAQDSTKKVVAPKAAPKRAVTTKAAPKKGAWKTSAAKKSGPKKGAKNRPTANKHATKKYPAKSKPAKKKQRGKR